MAKAKKKPALKKVYINTKSEFYKALKPYMKKGKKLVCAHRPLPSEEEIPFHESIGNGIFYAVGDLEKWRDVWAELDAALVVRVTNKQIEKKVRKLVEQETGQTLEEFLKENPDYGIADIAWDIFKLPYIEN